MLLLVLILLSFVAYKIYIKRYNKKNRPYLIEDEALKLVNGASPKVMSEALSQVYKRKKNAKICSKFNILIAKEIYFINLRNEVKEK